MRVRSVFVCGFRQIGSNLTEFLSGMAASGARNSGLIDANLFSDVESDCLRRGLRYRSRTEFTHMPLVHPFMRRPTSLDTDLRVANDFAPALEICPNAFSQVLG